MSPFEQLARYGVYIPVMTEREQMLLAEGKLRPTIIQLCGWCEALIRREAEIEKRVSEAMENSGRTAEKPPKDF